MVWTCPERWSAIAAEFPSYNVIGLAGGIRFRSRLSSVAVNSQKRPYRAWTEVARAKRFELLLPLFVASSSLAGSCIRTHID